MPNPPSSADDRDPTPAATVDDTDQVRQFVEHWGLMARSWGINSSMGELFALLYITGRDWTAEELRRSLGVSRGNVSMNLRELLAWGVVLKIHHPGERREFFRAEDDVWVLFRRILVERKRRELDPTLALLDRTARSLAAIPASTALRDRVARLQGFFALIDVLADRLARLGPDDLDELRILFDLSGPGPAAESPR